MQIWGLQRAKRQSQDESDDGYGHLGESNNLSQMQAEYKPKQARP